MLRIALPRVRLALSAVVVVVLFWSRAAAAEPVVPPAPVSSAATVWVNTVGDADWTVTCNFNFLTYPQAKAEYQKDADAFARRYFGMFLPDWAPERTVVPTMDDKLYTITGTWTTPGLAVPQKDGTWALPIHTVGQPIPTAFLNLVMVTTGTGWKPGPLGRDGRATLATDTAQHLGSASLSIWLPVDTRDVRILQSPLRVSFRQAAYVAPVINLDVYDPDTTPLPGTTAAEFDLNCRPYVIPALAKLYGNPRFSDMALARSTFKNTSKDLLTHYRVRFHLGDYTKPEWGPWQEVAEVRPGQTIVSPYYPLLDMERLASVTSPTAVDVESEYEYDQAGQHITGRGAQRTQMLGFDEVIYSHLAVGQRTTFQENFDLEPAVFAAYTTGNDPLVCQLAAWANRRAGGVAAIDNDTEALKFLESWYNLLADNGMVYQAAVGFDVPDNWGQRIRFPREALRDRTGTCIEEALLFASGCEAMGLKPVVCGVPGHCFPAVWLPSGMLIGVESTMIGRGSFQQALEYGTREYYRYKFNGKFIAADIASLRAAGFYSANMPKPTESLKDWGWKELPAQPVAAGTLSGTWKADIFNERVGSERNLAGQVVKINFPVREVQFNADGTVVFIHRGLDGKETISKGKYTPKKVENREYLTIERDAKEAEPGTTTGELTWVKDGGFRWIGAGFTLTFRRST